MYCKETPVDNYADLGDAWVRDQTARVRQKHLQLGGHWRLDMQALLARAARLARGATQCDSPGTGQIVWESTDLPVTVSLGRRAPQRTHDLAHAICG